MIYLDHAASTPLRPEVSDEMAPYLGDEFANPSGLHRAARTARRAVDDARSRLSSVLGCEPAEVVFTSGGTEADNLAVTGSAMAALSLGAERAVVCCSAVEHPAVAEPVRFLGGILVRVGPDGVLDLAALEEAVSTEADSLVLVSVMAVNNETGVIQPLEEAARVVRDNVPGALVHTDAVQAARFLDVAAVTAAADLVTVSGHKLGAPKGIGALACRNGAGSRLAPLLRGGPQEHELRAGTQNVPAIVGLAAAAELAAAERDLVGARVEALRDQLLAGIRAEIPSVTVAGEGAPRVRSILNVGFPGLSAEELLLALDAGGVAASGGSACASGALEPSPVLMAMGRPAGEARSHVRFSLGPETTPSDVAGAVGAIVEAFHRLAA